VPQQVAHVLRGEACVQGVHGRLVAEGVDVVAVRQPRGFGVLPPKLPHADAGKRTLPARKQQLALRVHVRRSMLTESRAHRP